MLARLLVALALLISGPAFAQQAISNLPQVATPRDADLLPLDVQSFPLGQRTHAVSAAGLAQYLLGKIPLGPQGIPGNTGPVGPANSLSVGTVSASDPGSNPLVSIVGTAPSQILNFTFPRGVPGPQGPQGLAGAIGPAGPQGVAGPTGAAGPPNVLSIGTVGTSDAGAPAAASVSGAAPNQALNLTLPRGIQGPIGPVGPTGNGTGNVLGPSGGSTAAHIATFSDTTGTRLSDGGVLGTAAAQPVAFFAQAGNNLSDLASSSAARLNLGLGTLAVRSDIVALDSSQTNVTIPNSTGNPGVATILAGKLDKAGGDASGTVGTATNGTTATSWAYRWGQHLNAKADFGAKWDGITDDTAVLNAAIAAIAARGGGTLDLPFGATVLSGLQLQQSVLVRGAGDRATIVKCAATNCITQPPGSQLSGASFVDTRIIPATAADASDTVMNFPTINQSEIGRLLIEGFTTGTILSTGGALATSVQDSNLGSNIIWNNFHDITAYGCSVCIVLQGHFPSVGATPDQVNTQNIYSNINLFYVGSKGYDFVNASDTNTFYGGLINFGTTGATGVVQGDDPNYSATANTYVNSNKFFGLAFSHQSNVTGLTMFGGNYSFATEGYGIETDIDTSNSNFVALNLPNAQSYRFCGKRLDALSNLLLGCQEKGIAWKQTQTLGPSTGFVIAWPQGFNQVTLTTSGTLATGQIQMPFNPPENVDFSLTTTGTTVTSLTIASASGAGQTIYGNPGTISPTTPLRFKYIAASKSWIRS